MTSRPYDVSDHVLSALATRRSEAAAELGPLVAEQLLTGLLDVVPDVLVDGEPGLDSVGQVRAAYVDHLLARLAVQAQWTP